MKLRNKLHHQAAAALAGLGLLTGAWGASAATPTWTGLGANANWSTPGNWNPGVPNPGDSLIFDGSTQTSPNNDYTAGTLFGGITFPGTAAGFLIGGNQIDLSGATVINNSGGPQEFALPLITATNGSGSGTLTFNTAGSDLLLDALISGSGAVLALGPNNLVLSNRSYTGGTIISNGMVIVANDQGPYTMSGGSLKLNYGSYWSAPSITFTTNSSVGTDAGRLDFAGNIGSPGFTWTKIGSGTINCVYWASDPTSVVKASAIDVAEGTLGSVVNGGTIVQWGGPTVPITVEMGASLEANDGVSVPNAITLMGGSGANNNGVLFAGRVNAGSSAVTNSFSNTITLAGDSTIGTFGGALALLGNITGPGGINQIGSLNGGYSLNTLILGGVNSYGGSTILNTGLVVLASSSALPGGSTNGDVMLLNTTTLDLGGFNATLNGLTDDSLGLATINNSGTNASTLTFGGKGDAVSFTGSLENSGGNPLSLVKIGAGSALFTGPNSCSGGLALQAGTLELNFPSGVASNGPVVVADGTTLTAHKIAASAAYKSPSMTLGSSGATTLNIDLGGFGSPSVAPFTVTNGAGTFSAGGTITVNITGDANLMSVGQFALIRYATRSGNGTFMLNSLPPNIVATLVTNASGKSIDLKITSAPVTTWVGNLNGNWDIATTKNWTILGVPSTYLDGAGVLFADGAATNYVNLTANVSPGGVLVNAATNYTFDGVGGIYAGNLTKNGAGTLSILTANNYGNTTISGGAVQLGNGGSAGTLGVGTVQDDAVLSFNSTNAIYFGNTVAGVGSLVKLNTNMLTLTTANSYSGGTYVSNGVVQLVSGSALGTPAGSTPLATVVNGGAVDLDGQSIANSSAFAIAGMGQGPSAGAIYNSGGGTCIGCGTIGLVTISLLADSAIGGNGGMWDVNGGIVGNGFALVKVGNNTINLRAAAASNPSRVIIGNGGLNYMRANCLGTAATTIVLTNNAWTDTWDQNNWNGYTVPNSFIIGPGGGQIRNSHGAWYGHADYDTYNGAITLNDTLTLVNSSTYTGSPNPAGVVTHGTQTFNGAISGSGGIIANAANSSGGNIITLNGANTYSGPTVVSGGTLAITTLQQGGGAYTVNDGATLTIGASAKPVIPMSSLTIGTSAGATLIIAVNSLSTSNAPIMATNLTIVGQASIVPPGYAFATPGQYPLVKYTGSIAGGGSFALGGGVRGVPGYLSNNVANSSLDLVVAPSNPVTWVGNLNNTWDINNTANFSFQGSGTTYQQTGASGDAVTFDDTSSQPIVNVSAPVSPTLLIVNNSAKNYTFTNSNFTGPMSLVKEGTGSVLLNNGANTFVGGTFITGGTIQLGNAASLNNVSGQVTVSPNGALDFNNQQPTTLACTISGAGYNGLGTLVQNSGNNNAYGPGSITMAGSATIGGTNRWDLRNGANTFNTPTNAYTLTKVGAGYTAFVGSSVSTNLGDIYILGGTLGYQTGTTGLGNPTNSIYVGSGGILEMYQASVPLNKFIVLSNSATIQPDSGGGGSGTSLTTQNIISGPITIVSGIANLNCNYLNGCAISNTISGAGGLSVGYNGYTRMYAPNTYTGDTSVLGGVYLFGNSCLLSTTNIYVNVGPLFLTNNAYVDCNYLNDNYGSTIVGGNANLYFTLMRVGGATLDVSGRVDGTLTLTNGETLRIDNGAIIKGNVVAGNGSFVSPGGNGYIQNTGTNFNNLTFLAGSTAAMDVSVTTTTNYDMINVVGTLTYGGTLAINRSGATPFAVGQAFKLFNAGTYAGSFSAITPATPGNGLAWDLSAINTGVVKIAVGVNTTPAPITWSFSTNYLNLAWPPDHLGWRLLVQTNQLNVGISTNWSAWPNSANVTNLSIPADPAAPAVFFKMVYP